LRNYAGIQILQSQKELQQFVREHLFFDAHTAKYRGDFIGFVESLNTKAKMLSVTSLLFRNSKTAYLSRLAAVPILPLPPTKIFWEKTNG
jgi:hypothetical protein